MLCFFIPRCGLHTGSRMKFRRRSSTSAAAAATEKEQHTQREKKKRKKEDISAPIPIVLDEEKLYGFQVNNNMFVLEGGGSTLAYSTSAESKSQQLETPSTGRCTAFTDGSSAGEPAKFNFSPSTVASYVEAASPSPGKANLNIKHSGNREYFRFYSRTRKNATGEDSERDGLISDSDLTGPSELDSCPESSPLHSYTPFPPKPPRMKQYRTFVCQNVLCQKQEVLLGHTEVLFRSCQFCFTHYCSPSCQHQAWKEHVDVCFYGQINSNLDTLIQQFKQDERNILISDVAYNGYQRKGRGCVFLVFSSPKRLDQFVHSEFQGFRGKPTFSTIADLTRHGVKNEYQKQLLEYISKYDPATQLVVSIAVVVGRKIPSNPVPRKKEVTVRKIVHIRMHQQYANTSVLLRESSLKKPILRKSADRTRRKTL